MPYIKEAARIAINNNDRPPANAGELNYAVFTDVYYDDDVISATKHVIQYWEDFGPSYQIANDIVGALTCCRLELRRRGYTKKSVLSKLADVTANFYADYVAPYEDRKIEENGDIL